MIEQSDLTYIKIPYPPNTRDLRLKIIVPTCPLVISPGLGNSWVTGKFSDPMAVIPLSIKQSRNVAEIVAVNAFAYRSPPSYLPQMTLSFGRLKPFSLSIAAGNIKDRLDFGGIQLSSLDIKYGEGAQMIDFSYPNPQVMSQIKLTADRGSIQIENLANAKASEIRLKGDSTRYQINFGGELKRNTNLSIGMAVSKVVLFITSGTAVKIASEYPPISIHKDDFTYADKAFWNGPAEEQQEPLLYIKNIASDSSVHISWVS